MNGCAKCVHKVDNWCATNVWDNLCKGHCDTSCVEECKTSLPPITVVDGAFEKTKETEEPVDCVMGEWGQWGGTTFNKDKCVRKRKRVIKSAAQHGGKPCGATVEEEATGCPEDCGDGHAVKSEGCDDGNQINGDGCSANCLVEAGWSCKENHVNGMSSCEADRCGDGKVVAQEKDMAGPHFEYMKKWGRFMGYGCDDGNTIDGDGCSSDCKVEPFHICDGGDETKPDTCKCLRYRRDYNTLSRQERDMYIAGVNELKKQGLYDEYVKIHAEENNKDYAHGTSGFLPWHRKYLLEYEESIRQLEVPKGSGNKPYKCVTIPYWDWGEDVMKCEEKGGCKTFHEESEILKDFGGPGDPTVTTVNGHGMWGGVSGSQQKQGHATSMGCVTKGPFAYWIDRHTSTPSLPYAWHQVGCAKLRAILYRSSELARHYDQKGEP